MALIDTSETYQMTNPGDHIDGTDVYQSNRNLLDNPWWGLNEVINQRGNTSGQTTHDAYSIDRWKMSHGSARGSWSIAEDGITITAASGTYALFGQVLANKDAIEGKTVTASVLLGDGTIVSGTIPSFTWATNPIAYEHNGLQLRFLASGTFRVNVTGGNSKTIRAVKLELGSVSTLANDVPPNYAEELRKCQYYFVRLHETANYGYFPVGFGAEQASSAIRMAIMTPTSLRRAPITVSFSGTLNITGNGTRTTVTSMSILDVSDTAVLASVVPASMPANQHTYTLSFGAQAYIDLSADL